jgi:hypothetical protein
MPTEKDKL